MVATPTSAPSRTKSRSAENFLVAFVYGAGSVIVILPLFLADVPALADYANHLARLHILASLDGDPDLQRFYQVVWAPAPNLAMDVLVPPLIKLFGTFTAGKIFVAAALLLPVAGTAALHAALFGRVGLWPALAFLFVYNQPFVLGFLNFLFTSGLALMAMAAWIATARWSPSPRLLLSAALAVVLYFGHFFAFSVYGLAVVGLELSRALEERRAGRFGLDREVRSWAFAMAQFLPAAALLLTVPTWGGFKLTHYGDLLHKVLVLFSPFLSYGGSGALTGLVFVAGAGMLAWKGGLELAPRMRVALAILIVAAMAMPKSIEGNWFTDLRLPVLVVWCFVASTRPAIANATVAWSIGCVCALLLASNVAQVNAAWRTYDRDYAEFRQAARQIERGALVLPVQVDRPFDPDAESRSIPYLYWHMVSLAVIDRGVFYPLLFTNPSAQPVRVRPDFAHLDVANGPLPWPESLLPATDPARIPEVMADSRHSYGPVYWKDWQHEYDYVVLIRREFDQPNPAPGLLEPLVAGTFFDIYRVVRSQASDRGASD